MKKRLLIIALFILLFFTTIGLINLYIIINSQGIIFDNTDDVPTADAALILGSSVFVSGRLSDVLEDRVTKAIELYQKGKVKKFLLSGDHGQIEYDEVNAMKNYLLKRNIPAEDIFLDHAGFETYDSIYRAKEIFCARSIIITTQKYHLYRAVFIAKRLDLPAYGVISDNNVYIRINWFKFREYFARVKAFFKAFSRPTPRYLGEKIPLTGDSKKSWD